MEVEILAPVVEIEAATMTTELRRLCRTHHQVILTIPATSTEIKSADFNKCIALTKLHFPDNSILTTIGTYAFTGCKKLTEVHLPASLTTIENYAFQGCTAITEIRCLSTQLGIITPWLTQRWGLAAICPAAITDMGGNQYILDLTIPLAEGDFNPVEQLMTRYGAEIDAGQDPEVDNDNVEARIVSGDIDISHHLYAIRKGKVDFRKLVLVYVYKN